jgi:predicted transcriptional regulator
VAVFSLDKTCMFFLAGCKRVLIFVEQKRQADFLASFLSQTEFPTTSIHGYVIIIGLKGVAYMSENELKVLFGLTKHRG